MTLFLILAHERVEGGLLLFKHNKNILMMMSGGPQLCLRGGAEACPQWSF